MEDKSQPGKAESEREISAEELKAFMDSLACESFKVDVHSRFCDECGFARSDHRRRQPTSQQKG